MDREFLEKLAQGLYDSTNRGIASAVGAPVDLTALAAGLAGYKQKQPVGGSEWIGQQMQNYGVVSPERNETAENIAMMALTPMRIKAMK